mmetsp:Transcript_85579/g.223314  ORF Transcript_85579/g.223314 Transcript_85579/m.223314 type:complete len:287 (+) Transcript_85579:94-954(+)
MSVTGYMYNINASKKLAELELSEGLEGNRSWHHQFRHSAYIYVGGLHQGLTEGDFAIVFSQFGEIVDVNLVRDKATGKSKGFGFICYEDQRSTVLAVDNMNGFSLLGRTLRVDHVDKYKAPKDLDEENLDENGDPTLIEYKATGAEGLGHGVYNVIDGQKKIDAVQSQKRKQPEKKGTEDEDEAWAKAFEDGLKKGQDDADARRQLKELRKAKKELKNMKKEAKMLKKAAKKAKKAKKVKKEKGVVKKEKKAVSSSEDSDDSEDDSEEDSPSSEEARAKHKKAKRK